MTDKIDFRRRLKPLYGPTRRQGIHLVTVPPMRYLMVDGVGDPNTEPAYGAAVAALYGLAYALKFASSRQLGRDYVVPPLEGLWWATDWADFQRRDKASWHWTMMIMLPEWIGPALVARTIEAVGAKKKAPAALAALRVDMLEEGRCVQALHIGPYDAEGPLIARMHDAFMPAHGLAPCGKHHEIYLSDPRKSAPDKLRTVLRQPVVQKAGIA